MLLPKPERILRWDSYPDNALLERLQHTDFQDANIPEHEFLQFRRLQSLIYSLRVAGYDVEAMQTEAFIGAVLFARVNCKVAITRCEYDHEINRDVIRQVSKRLPKDIIWVTTNANIDHPYIKPLPIGITDYCGYSSFHQIIGDTGLFKSLSDERKRTQKRLVLLNFFDQSNVTVRSYVRSLFQDKEFVTVSAYTRDPTGYARYVDGLRSHPFCLSPRGTGIDTHRTWECLYAGCIPIVQRTPALKDFSELPILFVNEWQEACDPDHLSRSPGRVLWKKVGLAKIDAVVLVQVCFHVAYDALKPRSKGCVGLV